LAARPAAPRAARGWTKTKMVLEKREMLYEMNRIDQAHLGFIMPSEGLGMGRKWIVLVEAYEKLRKGI
jgi:hypothetical protein